MEFCWLLVGQGLIDAGAVEEAVLEVVGFVENQDDVFQARFPVGVVHNVLCGIDGAVAVGVELSANTAVVSVVAVEDFFGFRVGVVEECDFC